jgi:cytochrome c oxidase subunit 2
MGGPQAVLIIVFALIAVAMAAIFVVIAINANKDIPYENVTKVGYFLRRYWLILLIAIAVIQVGISTAFMPYSKAADPDVVVKVNGYQFSWSIDKARIPANSLVQFDVSTADVNHGVGVYDPDGKMLASVQAMPGYTNKFQLRLKKSGTYLIACLEYCGLGHHKMLKNFEVTREK